jgi:hypothetical protein
MPFTEKTVRAAFSRAAARCECGRATCGHAGRCPKRLTYDDHTKLEGGWRANYAIPVHANGADTLGNCEILCAPCYREAFGSVQP